MNKLRNIGLVAHINAGKTTTTERILYHAGSTRIVGDVDKGNTITDYLIQERDRGITVTSAAVSYNYKKHRVNLIDTPGHVDFTVEVERSLSVIDGVVTILDSSAGVEAQTITVWNQAKKYQLPNLVFLNKFDKPLADYKSCLEDIRESFDTIPCLIQLPIKNEKLKSLSIIDIIDRQHLNWIDPENNYGSKFETKSIFEGDKLDRKISDNVEEHREKLINSLTDCDDEFANHVVECDRINDVNSDQIEAAIRRQTLNCRVAPVLVGSSFKYIGVQQLMNSIIKYLPNPEEREIYIRNKLNNYLTDNDAKTANSAVLKKTATTTCGFIFKIVHDPRLGPLTFIKVCNGSLKKQQRLKNLNQNCLEQTKRVYRAFADEMSEILEPIAKNDIVAVSGLTQSRTGDILIESDFYPSSSFHDANDCEKRSSKDKNDSTAVPFRLLNGQILVPKIRQLEPVYHCSIESRNISQQLKLEHALACLSREDPSFKYEIDQHGLTTIRGMGKLHLEIIRDRIESEYRIEPLLGPLQISYRESITSGYAIEELSINRLINSISNKISIRLHVSKSDSEEITTTTTPENCSSWTGKLLSLDTGPNADASLLTLRRDHRKAIEQGIESALAHGPIRGYPVINCNVMLMQFQANNRCSLPVISSAASQCVLTALKRCAPILLEPISMLEVILPREFNGTILGDLNQRRAHILETVARDPNSRTLVTRALVPLSSLADYSEFLRIHTSGRATFSMDIHSYSPMSDSNINGS